MNDYTSLKPFDLLYNKVSGPMNILRNKVSGPINVDRNKQVSNSDTSRIQSAQKSSGTPATSGGAFGSFVGQ